MSPGGGSQAPRGERPGPPRPRLDDRSGPQERPGGPQETPKMTQERPGRPPGRPGKLPGGPKRHPGASQATQDAPRTPQECPRRPLGSSRQPSRQPSGGHQRRPGAPQDARKHTQNAPRAPDDAQDRPRHHRPYASVVRQIASSRLLAPAPRAEDALGVCPAPAWPEHALQARQSFPQAARSAGCEALNRILGAILKRPSRGTPCFTVSQRMARRHLGQHMSRLFAKAARQIAANPL